MKVGLKSIIFNPITPPFHIISYHFISFHIISPYISPIPVLPIHLALRLVHFAGHAPGRRKGATGEVRPLAHGGDPLGRLVVGRSGDADHVGGAVVAALSRSGDPGELRRQTPR